MGSPLRYTEFGFGSVELQMRFQYSSGCFKFRSCLGHGAQRLPPKGIVCVPRDKDIGVVMGNINQAGIDFNGHGIFEMKGAWARYFQVPPYEQSKSRVIVL